MAFFDDVKRVLHIDPDEDYVRVVRDPRCSTSSGDVRFDDDDDDDDDFDDDDW